jgi:UDP-N-acetylglucosamine 2-epimerase (non-hydrolysing)
MRVMTIVGTRPEVIKLSRVIPALDRHFEHTLVHTGQNYDYELNQVFFEDLDIRKPDLFLNAVGKTTAETIANVLVSADRAFAEVVPDALLLYGDTNSCLAVISAKRRRIPIFHMEAGNRCFDQRVPEEVNRKVVDHLSDVNLPLTEHARRYLIAEGLRPETTIKTGSCMREVFTYYWPKIERSEAVERMGLQKGAYFIASVHREENVDDPSVFSRVRDAISAVAAEFDVPVVLSTHPRTMKRLDSVGGKPFDPRVVVSKAFSFTDYVSLQRGARCVISDSGSLTEEASLLGLPGVTIREAHERPEGMDEGTVVMSGLEPRSVVDSVRMVTTQSGIEKLRPAVVPDYQAEAVSLKVARIIQSYTGYVNRVVWRR